MSDTAPPSERDGRGILHANRHEHVLYEWKADGFLLNLWIALGCMLAFIAYGIHEFPPGTTIGICCEWWMAVFAFTALVLYLLEFTPVRICLYPGRIEVAYCLARRIMPLGDITAVRRRLPLEIKRGPLMGVRQADLVSRETLIRIPSGLANDLSFHEALGGAAPWIAIDDCEGREVAPIGTKWFLLIALVLGTGFFFLLDASRNRHILLRDDSPTMLLCLAIGMAAYIMALPSAALLNSLAGRSNPPRAPWSSVPFTACVIAMMGMPFLSFEIIRAVNTGLDRHEIVANETFCLDKHMSEYRHRGSTSHTYRVILADWKRPGYRICIDDEKTYELIGRRSMLLANTKPGALGLEWLVSVQPLPHGVFGTPEHRL